MYATIKRLFDFSVSGLAILVLLPLLLPIALLLRLTGEGKVLYRQERLGYKNKTFKIVKFATMLEDSPNMKGGEITLENDPRITPMGGFLRKTKINELPQLWNVFVGEMSIVGPRPLMQVSFEMYLPQVQEIVYDSKPGLTGIGSLIFRNEADLVARSRSDPRQFYRDVIYPHKGALEEWYHQNKSFMTDIKVVFLTAVAIALPKANVADMFSPCLPVLPVNIDGSSDSLGSENQGEAQ